MEETLEALYKSFLNREVQKLNEIGGRQLLTLLQMREIVDQGPSKIAECVEKMRALESQMTKLREELVRENGMVLAAKAFYNENKNTVITPQIIQRVLDIPDDEYLIDGGEEEEFEEIDEMKEEEFDDEEDPLNPRKVNEITDNLMRENPPLLAQMMESEQENPPAKKQRRMLPNNLSNPYRSLADGLCIYCCRTNDCVCACFECRRTRVECECEHFFKDKRVKNAYVEMCECAKINSKKFGKSVSVWRQLISREFQNESFGEKKEFFRKNYRNKTNDHCLICLRDGEMKGICRQCKKATAQK